MVPNPGRGIRGAGGLDQNGAPCEESGRDHEQRGRAARGDDSDRQWICHEKGPLKWTSGLVAIISPAPRCRIIRKDDSKTLDKSWSAVDDRSWSRPGVRSGHAKPDRQQKICVEAQLERFHVAWLAISAVMPALSRPKDGVASLAYVAGIPLRGALCSPDRDGRDKPGHDAESLVQANWKVL
jgi:hypothetical protein